MATNMQDSPPGQCDKVNKVGVIIASTFGAIGLALVAVTTPFLLPALRKHCLPYLPATDTQLANLRKAFQKHAKPTETFIDVGSGDGRICRLANKLDLFSKVHGVELNSWLVLYSRLQSISSRRVSFYRRDLWKFPLREYDAICIFGVESMMDPLEAHLRSQPGCRNTIYACRFPFRELEQIDEIGAGIDTVWVYKL